MLKIFLFIGIICNVMAQIFLKKAMTGMDLAARNYSVIYLFKTVVLNPQIIFALCLYGLSFFLYAIVLSKIELSRAYPIASVSAILLVCFFSIFLLNETVSISKIIGITLCIAGIIILL